MTATQAVLAVAVPAAIVLAILAVPAIRRRHAQHQRAVTATAGWCDDDRTAVLSTPEAVAPLRAALERAGALPDVAPANPLDALIARADEELAANEEFRAWLAGTVPTHLGGER